MSESIGAAAGELRRIADAAPSGEVADLGDAIERVRDQLGELVGTEYELTEHAEQLATATASVYRDLVALRQALHTLPLTIISVRAVLHRRRRPPLLPLPQRRRRSAPRTVRSTPPRQPGR